MQQLNPNSLKLLYFLAQRPEWSSPAFPTQLAAFEDSRHLDLICSGNLLKFTESIADRQSRADVTESVDQTLKHSRARNGGLF
jgi:hypothetical protein